MESRLLLGLLVAVFGAALAAQGMTRDYIQARTEARFARPHGLSAELDVLGFGAVLRQYQRVRAEGLPGDTVDYERDAGAPPYAPFFNAEFRLRFSWHDSVEVGYGFHLLRAFEDNLGRERRFNGVAYPEGVDLNYRSDFHDFRALYRRDLFRMGLSKSMTFYGLLGLEWAVIETEVSSDSFPVQGGREKERFRELLPWYNAGLGTEIEVSPSIRVSLSGRGAYVVGMPTFQKRDGNNVKQSIVSADARFTLEYRVLDWLAIVGRARYRLMNARLYGGFRQSNYVLEAWGPELGIGLRF
jgi:hypothetical protein